MADGLANSVVLVAGGAGTVGSGIVKAFLDAGANVVVPSRGADRLQKLREEFGNPDKLHTVEADVSSEEGIATVLKFIDETLGGQLDHVVASLGSGVWNTPVIGDKPESFFMEVVHDHAGSHYAVANATLKRIADKPGASLLIISGGLGGVHMPGSGFTTIGEGALFALSIVLRGETAERAVRVNELRIGTIIKRATSMSHGIGKLVAGVATSKTKGEVIPLNAETEIPGLLQQYT